MNRIAAAILLVLACADSQAKPAKPPNPSEPPVLRAVRSARQPAFDRVVFEFNSAKLPRWEAKLIEQPVLDCGSGEPVPVAGRAWLQVRFNGAQAHTEQGRSSSGPRRRKLPLKLARELVRTCDFEGEVTWVIGLRSQTAFTPRSYAKPARLIIDIAHRPAR